MTFKRGDGQRSGTEYEKLISYLDIAEHGEEYILSSTVRQECDEHNQLKDCVKGGALHSDREDSCVYFSMANSKDFTRPRTIINESAGNEQRYNNVQTER